MPKKRILDDDDEDEDEFPIAQPTRRGVSVSKKQRRTWDDDDSQEDSEKEASLFTTCHFKVV